MPEGGRDIAAIAGPPGWPIHGGEMAATVRAHDWAATPLGPLGTWSQGRKAVVDLLLASSVPMVALLGPDLVQIYNDGYRALMGIKHPVGLGQSARACCPEVWPMNEAIYDRVQAGETLSFEDKLFPIRRRGTLEDAWFTVSYSPLRDEDGGVAGVLITVSETTQRHIAEAALRASEARFRAVAEQAEVGIAVTDTEGVLTFANDRFCEIIGRCRAEVLGRTMRDLTHPDDWMLNEPLLRRLKATGEAFTLDKRYLRGDGSAVWVRNGASALRDEAGCIAGTIVASVDINERRATEAALRESVARFRLMADAVPQIVWITDAEGRVEFFNRQWSSYTGASSGPATAAEVLSGFIHPDDAAVTMERLGEARRTGGTFLVEHRIRSAAGDYRWFLVRADPHRDQVTGEIARWFGTSVDIHDRKLAGAALRDSEARFRSFVENSTDALWIIDAETGRLEYLSPAYETVWGEPRERIMQDPGRWAELVHPDDRARAGRAMPRVLAGKVCTVEYRIVRPDGSVRWVRDTGFPMPDEQGRIRRVGGIAQDVTEQKAAEERLRDLNAALETHVAERTAELMASEATLRQAQKMEAVGQLTGGIAHDFNNMLQGIAGSLELMRRRTEQGRLSEATRYVDSARTTVQRAAALTHRLLAFARQLPLDPAPVDLDKLVNGMIDLIRRTVGPAVQVELRLGDGKWLVLCDENQLENALLNLCVNARDAMPDGGWLTVSTADVHLSAADLDGEEGLEPGAYAVIAVTDTGSGMDAELVARVFEPFFTTKPLGQGTGLGLSQVYGFVRQSGGLVRIESAPGAGTTVRLLLPRHEPAPEGAQDGSAMADVVVLVEDEATLRETTAEWLRESGCRVLEAQDGAAALRLLNGAGRVDALVTDVGLPGGLNGRQVADAAREQRPDLPVLFMTGYAGTMFGAELPPGMDVIDKPFDLTLLSERVSTMLETARASRADSEDSPA